MEESEVVKIMENYTGYVDRSRTDQCLHEVNFNFVAKDITKKLNSMKLSNKDQLIKENEQLKETIQQLRREISHIRNSKNIYS